MARPKQSIKRTEIIRTRFTSAERRLIKSFANNYGITISSFVRAKTLDHKLTPRLTPEEATMLRALIGMANNINAIAKKLHMGDVIDNLIAEAMDGLNEQIKKLK